jgi:hypothetical protein
VDASLKVLDLMAKEILGVQVAKNLCVGQERRLIRVQTLLIFNAESKKKRQQIRNIPALT